MFQDLATHPLVAGAVYSFIAAMTPGPNNLMLLSSGMTFGLRRTLPHMFGVAGGFLVLMTVVIVGVGALLNAVPTVRWGLLIAGSPVMAPQPELPRKGPRFRQTSQTGTTLCRPAGGVLRLRVGGG